MAGDSEEEVLEQVKTAITDLRTSSHIVRLNVPPIAGEEDDPWLRYAGLWADDPDWDIFQTEIETFRRAIDAQTEADIS